MAMISANIGGITKRATVSAIYFIMYCVGNIIGPQLFFESRAPRYQVRLIHTPSIEMYSTCEMN